MVPSRISLESMIGEVRRELNYRRQIFPRSVARGTMNAHDAAFRFDCMESVLATLIELRGQREGQGGLKLEDRETPFGSGHTIVDKK